MKFVRLLCILAAFLSPAVGQQTSSPRRIGDDQPLRHSISKLSASQQRVLVTALKAAILQRLRSLDDDQTEAEAETRIAVQRLRIEDVSTKGGVLTLVQGWGLPLCGGTGNCSLWVLDTTAVSFWKMREMNC